MVNARYNPGDIIKQTAFSEILHYLVLSVFVEGSRIDVYEVLELETGRTLFLTPYYSPPGTIRKVA